jgi:uncharacterized protein YgiM (DUF1202 family)
MTLALVAALSAALLFQLFAPGVAAAGFAAGDRVVVNTDALNVRGSAGLNGRVVHVATSGMTGTVKDGPKSADAYVWYRVTFDAGPTGWVAAEFLAAPSSSGGRFALGQRVEVATDALNVRAQAGLAGKVVNVLPAGAQAYISSAPVRAGGYTWYPLDAMGVTLGWVAGEYLQPSDDGGQGIPSGTRMAVAVTALNVRAQPGLNGKVVNVLPLGYQLFLSGDPVQRDGYVWYQVTAMGQTLGWVAADYLVSA